jgi:hypothetical protein
MWPGVPRSVTRTVADPACCTAFVVASCRMRYSSSETQADSSSGMDSSLNATSTFDCFDMSRQNDADAATMPRYLSLGG